MLVGIHRENLEKNTRAQNDDLPCVILFSETGEIVDTIHTAQIVIDGRVVAEVVTSHKGIISTVETGPLRAAIQTSEQVIMKK